MKTMRSIERPQMVSKRGQVAERRQGDAQHPARADGEHLADVHQVGGEEGDQQHLGELARLEADGPDGEPQPGPVDLAAEERGDHEQEQTPAMPSQYLWSAQRPQVAHEGQHQQEGDQPDHQPHGLLEGQVLVDAVEQQQTQGGEQRRHRQQVGVGLGGEHPARRGGRWRTAPGRARRT